MRALGAVAALAVWAVSAQADRASAQADRVVTGIAVPTRGRALQVHLAAAAKGQSAPLILYATGDGGWPGAERLFDRMMPFGLPMAGFSSVDYVFETISPPARTIEPTAIAADFQRIIDAGIQALKLPRDQPVVLVGFSRGASLSVAAASVPAFRARLQGVMALALAAADVYVANSFEPYAAVAKLEPLKVVVIQSARDEVLSAAEARRRLGPDTPTRQLRAIDARDHSFGGKLDELLAEIKTSLDWLRVPAR